MPYHNNKACNDCKYSVGTSPYDKCNHSDAKEECFSVNSGLWVSINPKYIERSNYGKCGYSGKNFEPSRWSSFKNLLKEVFK